MTDTVLAEFTEGSDKLKGSSLLYHEESKEMNLLFPDGTSRVITASAVLDADDQGLLTWNKPQVRDYLRNMHPVAAIAEGETWTPVSAGRPVPKRKLPRWLPWVVGLVVLAVLIGGGIFFSGILNKTPVTPPAVEVPTTVPAAVIPPAPTTEVPTVTVPVEVPPATPAPTPTVPATETPVVTGSLTIGTGAWGSVLRPATDTDAARLMRGFLVLTYGDKSGQLLLSTLTNISPTGKAANGDPLLTVVLSDGNKATATAGKSGGYAAGGDYSSVKPVFPAVPVVGSYSSSAAGTRFARARTDAGSILTGFKVAQEAHSSSGVYVRNFAWMTKLHSSTVLFWTIEKGGEVVAMGLQRGSVTVGTIPSAFRGFTPPKGSYLLRNRATITKVSDLVGTLNITIQVPNDAHYGGTFDALVDTGTRWYVNGLLTPGKSFFTAWSKIAKGKQVLSLTFDGFSGGKPHLLRVNGLPSKA